MSVLWCGTALALLVVALGAATPAQAQAQDYGLMIDAGSTKSRIHVFAW